MIKPRLGRTYPLNQLPDAMRRLQAGEACGKLAITVRAGHRAATEHVSADTETNEG